MSTSETSKKQYRIESLLSARLLLRPRIVGEHLYFIGNLSGRLSLYVMDRRGSLPRPLLPPHVALQNPKLIGGLSYAVFPSLGIIVVMVDDDGDERYRPMYIPIDGGYPKALFPDTFIDKRVFLASADRSHQIAYFRAECLERAEYGAFQASLAKSALVHLGSSTHENCIVGASPQHDRVLLIDLYTEGDAVLYEWSVEEPRRRVLYGTPLEERSSDEHYPRNGIGDCFYSRQGAIIAHCAVFDDAFGLARLEGNEFAPLAVHGLTQDSPGELHHVLQHTDLRHFLLEYNLNGCSCLCSASLSDDERTLSIDRILTDHPGLRDGVIESFAMDEARDEVVLSFSSPTTPCQLYTLKRTKGRPQRRSNERILGIPTSALSKGEDASFTSHDGLTVPARIYLPARQLELAEPYPVVFYIHGGPQSQERPDFTWFSMPLVQFFTLNGMAVFVPNIRGSQGYGLSYTSRVDHDWGGQDRLDLVTAHQLLAEDCRLDTNRVGVMGRSYGGYMTLTLASRHPELWQAACDLFGPSDLLTFVERIPPAWKPYFHLAIGHPDRDHDFLVERSPSTYLANIQCPLLVIQGQNDPRVIEAESRAVVEQMQQAGKQVEYLVFPDEGHDILEFDNRVHCYNKIVSFFKSHLSSKS